MSRKVIGSKTSLQYDVGSRIDGYITQLLASGIQVTQLDIREFPIRIDGLNFIQADATNMVGIESESIDSLSSLHAIEHFGLGRYGDEIDPDAWKKALHAFSRVLKKGGRLYLSVPIATRNILVFNAHRIFKPSTIIDELSTLELVDFAYIENYQINRINFQ